MALTDLLTLTPKNNINGISIQATIEEINSDSLQITEHPVEQGAAISDHSYKRPSELVLKCGWSNSTLESSIGSISSLFEGGSVSMSDYISNIYSQLLALQESRTPFKITTSKREYDNMLIAGLQVTTDNQTNNILMVSATCKQIIIVKTQATKLPPASSQADPASTSGTENTGVKQPVSATPSPGGSAPPSSDASGGW